MGQSIDSRSGPLEERVARLSISIGAHAARVGDERDREMVLTDARNEIMQGLFEQGHTLHDAALIADDIVDAARKLAAELTAGPYRVR